MLIVMFSDSYKPRISGVVNSLASTASQLRGLGHRVLIFAPTVPGYRDEENDIIRIPSLLVSRRVRDFPIPLPAYATVERVVKHLSPDIVHVHSPFVAGVLGSRLARAGSVPLFFTYHTLYGDYVHYIPLVPARLSRPVVTSYAVRFCNGCDCVIAPATAIRDRLRGEGVRVPIEVLSTAALDAGMVANIDPSWVRPRFGIPNDVPMLVHLGRLGKEKSIEFLLEALADRLRDRRIRLLIVGGGPEELSLTVLARRLGIDHAVVFAGALPRQRALECCAAGDIFVTGSLTETTGIVLVEAMAVGIPIIAVNAGGVADAVKDGENGFLVPQSREAFAAAVNTLLGDAAMARRMGAAGREMSVKFSAQETARRLLGLYEAAIEQRRSVRT